MDPYFRMKQDEACHDFIKKRFPDYPLYNMESNLVQAEYVVPDMMLVGAIQPNMIIAAALGSEFVFAPDKGSDVKGFPLKDIKDVKDLPPVSETTELKFIADLKSQYVEAKEKYPECRVIPPFFWDTSGRATIHGIITTSMKFIGQEIFTLMMMEPDLVKGIHAWIADVYIEVIKFFSKLRGSAVTSVHVGECSGHHVDESSYLEFGLSIHKQAEQGISVQCGFTAAEMRIMLCVQYARSRTLGIIDTGSDTSLALIRELKGREFEINVSPPVDYLLRRVLHRMISGNGSKDPEGYDGGNLKIAYTP
jgi:hypothetical protein